MAYLKDLLVAGPSRFIGDFYINGDTVLGTAIANSNRLVTINGKLVVEPSYNTATNSYNEGIRINRASTGWSGIYIGGTRGTTSATGLGTWLIAAKSTPGDATTAAASITDSQFYISYNGSSSAACRITGHNATGFSIRPRLAVNTDVNTSFEFYVNGSTCFNIGTSDNTSHKKINVYGNNRYLSIGASGLQAYTGALSATTASTLYLNYNGGTIQIGQTSSIKAPMDIYGEVSHKAGHIYLEGSTSSSTSNTTQLVFGTSSTQHVALSANPGKFVINPSTSSTTGQVVLVPGGTSVITSGRLTINASANDTYNLYVSGTSLHNGIVYFANGTTYYINNSGTGNLNALTINSTTDSSSTSTGGLIVKGGTGIAKTLYVGTGINAGNITVGGTVDTDAGKTISSSSTLYLKTTSGASIIFGTNGTNRMRVNTEGYFAPEANNTYDIGQNTLRFKIAYAQAGYFGGASSAAGGVYLYTNSTNYGRFYVSTVGTANVPATTEGGTGTEGTLGYSILSIGNSTAVNTTTEYGATASGANNSRGQITLYGSNNRAALILAITTDYTSNRYFYIPNYNGTMYAVHNGGSAVGSATLPVYVTAGGRVTACTAGSVFSALSWTAGTSSGPVLNVTVAGQSRTSTIPSAGASASGIVTTGTQTLAGAKTFSGNTTFSGRIIVSSSNYGASAPTAAPATGTGTIFFQTL